MVQAAQSFDQHAIDRLCEAFRPLIIAEAHRSYVIGKLGDDAENTAWEIFLEFIHSYKGNKYRLLPGLIQTNLSYELLHRVYPRSLVSVQGDALLDITDEDGKALLEPSDNNACIDGFFEDSFFEEVYKHLTPKQVDIIDAVYRHNLSLAEYAEQQCITYTGAYRLEQRALNILSKVLAAKLSNK